MNINIVDLKDLACIGQLTYLRTQIYLPVQYVCVCVCVCVCGITVGEWISLEGGLKCSEILVVISFTSIIFPSYVEANLYYYKENNFMNFYKTLI